MWQAEIKEKEMIDGNLIFTVVYSKEDKSFVRKYNYTYVPGMDQLNSAIKNDISTLEQLDAFSEKVSLGPVVLNADESQAIETAVENVNGTEKPKE